MIDARTQAVLQEIVGRETRSLLMYMGDAFPWTTSRGEAALTALNRLIKEERAAISALGRYLARRHVPLGPAGSYPSHFTSYNFIALTNLLPRLVESETAGVAALDRDLPALLDAGAKAQVKQLLDGKRRHLAELTALAAPAPETAA